MRRLRTQLGFTLVEVLVAMCVGGLILGAASTTLVQLFKNSNRNAAHLTAVKQVENAVHFLIRDVQTAQTIETTGLDTGEVLRVSWVAYDGVFHQVTYEWNVTDKLLTRVQFPGDSSTPVAHSIESEPVFTKTNGTVIVDLTCSVQGHDEHRTVKISQRAGS